MKYYVMLTRLGAKYTAPGTTKDGTNTFKKDHTGAAAYGSDYSSVSACSRTDERDDVHFLAVTVD